MKALKKLGILSAGVLALSLSACGGDSAPKYLRDDDDLAYQAVLGDYEALYKKAKAISDDNERFVAYAEAEAALMDSATFMPTTTQGGNYAVTRVAPRTIPYSFWGNDEDRLKNTVIVRYDENKKFIKGSERAEMIANWEKAKKGEGTYDPAAYLTGKGYQVGADYIASYSTFPETLDVLNTSMAADTESLVNAVEGLVEYDNFGVLHGQIAEDEWDVEVKEKEDEEGNVTKYNVYTFHLKEGRKWYKADGTEYGEVKADDFVAGFQHMMDAAAGLEWLTEGVILNASEYLAEKVTFDKVGVKAIDDYTVEFTLEVVESFFTSRLTYSCFMPMNRAFFLSKGGAFGVKEFAEAAAKDSYKYGLVSSAENSLYNGPYVPDQLTDGTIVSYKLNTNYPGAANIATKNLKWIYDSGENPTAYYESAVAGDINAVGLGSASGLLQKSKDDGLFDDYAYVTDTNAVTFFGGFNVNRGTFETGSVKSKQAESTKEYTHRAMGNINFRRALQHAWDRKTWNGVSVGEELAEKSLRNIYTAPEFVSLTKDVTIGEGEAAKTFKAGSSYGELVQYFLTKAGRACDTKDGVDGWFNADLAKSYFDQFKLDMEDYVQYPIQLDVVYYSASVSNTAQAQAFKKSLEETLGKDNIKVNLNAAATSQDYYAAGYRAPDGKSGNFDVFYGSGWGPDYGDPSTYLDTFLGGGAGYMCKVIGLY